MKWIERPRFDYYILMDPGSIQLDCLFCFLLINLLFNDQGRMRTRMKRKKARAQVQGFEARNLPV